MLFITENILLLETSSLSYSEEHGQHLTWLNPALCSHKTLLCWVLFSPGCQCISGHVPLKAVMDSDREAGICNFNNDRTSLLEHRIFFLLLV